MAVIEKKSNMRISSVKFFQYCSNNGLIYLLNSDECFSILHREKSIDKCFKCVKGCEDTLNIWACTTAAHDNDLVRNVFKIIFQSKRI